MAAAPSSEQFARHIRKEFKSLYGPPFMPAPDPITAVMRALVPPGPSGPNSSSISN